MIDVKTLLAMVEQIAAEEPAYMHGHTGKDGYCDCIGLIIGAIRRAGGQWRGIHGSNYAARCEVLELLPIEKAASLVPGEVVFKAYAPDQGGYDLPARYEKGGEHYTGDLNDYYHVGIVESVTPLRIRHMTTPRGKMDTAIGKWGWHGKLKMIDYAGGGEKVEVVKIAGGNAEKPVNMRKSASSASPIIALIPQGSTVDLLESGANWSRVRYENQTGFVMNAFVHREDSEDTVAVSKKELERAYDILGDLLGLRG